MRRSSRCRLKVLASHPIQYFTPIYRLLADHPQLDLEVLYCRDFGVTERFDKQFGQRIRWDTDQLSGYSHRFLRNLSPIVDPFNPLHAINPGAFTRVLANADAVWVNGYAYPSNWFAVAAAMLRGAAVLVRSDMRLDPSRVPHKFERFRAGLIRSWIRRSDALLYVGKENKRAYLHYGAHPSQLFFSPYSVDVQRIEAARCRLNGNEVRERWGVSNNRLVVLFVGKLTQQKNPEAVLDLACNSGLQHRIHVVFAGSGPLESRMRERVAAVRMDNVTFLGFVNQTKLPDVYAAADLFILPSDGEAWGLVVNEAMAAGAVSIVSDGVGAAPDLISEGVTGFTFPSCRWDVLERIVCRVVCDEALRRNVSEQARARVREYTHEAAADGIIEALRALGRLPEPQRPATR